MGSSDTLAALDGMSAGDLRAHWCKVTGEAPPRVSPSLLRLALAWELQARAGGGLSRQAQQTLAQFAARRTRTSPAMPGTRLVREWRGQVHVVEVDPDGGVRWNGKGYRSLSEVARAITGTRWSGPAFFGLKQRIQAA